MQTVTQGIQRFSIRKCAFGAVSVLVGAFLMGVPVSAQEGGTAVATTMETVVTNVVSQEETSVSEEASKVDRDSTAQTEASAEENVAATQEVTTEAKTVVPKPKILEKPAPSQPTKQPATVVVTPVVPKANPLPKLEKRSLILGDDYPAFLRNAAPDSIVDPWCLYNRECVSFVAHRLEKVNGFKIPPAYGNAYSWGHNARGTYRVDKIPKVGSVAWWSAGHVAWVAEVTGDQLVIEEYNYGYNHCYNRRTISVHEVDGFIHFKDVDGQTAQITAVGAAKVTSGMPASGRHTFTEKAIIRSEAKLSSPELAHYEAGQSVNYDRTVESDGYQWLSYLSYNGNRRYIAIKALKEVKPEGTLSVTNKNGAKGTFDVVISNVTYSSAIKEVQVPIWSDQNGQDDLVWYKATKQADGTYKVSVNAARHKNSRGKYLIHLYYQPVSGHKICVAHSSTVLEGVNVAKPSGASKPQKAVKQTLPSKGSYRFTKATGVKNQPKASDRDLATYQKGDVVHYDKVLVAEGKQWISYISYSGVRRYVAVD